MLMRRPQARRKKELPEGVAAVEKKAPADRKQKTFYCTWKGCASSFSRRNDMQRHVEAVHLKLKPFACDWPGCRAAFAKQGNLNSHKATVHRKIRPFACDRPDCNASFSVQKHLITHQQTVHDGRKPFACDVSDPGSSRERRAWCAAATHARLSGTEGRRGERPATRRMRARHGQRILTRRHPPLHCPAKLCTASPTRQWPGCNATFGYRGDRNRHRAAVHFKVKPFSCVWPSCNATFAKRGDMKRHFRNVHEKARAAGAAESTDTDELSPEEDICNPCDADYPSKRRRDDGTYGSGDRRIGKRVKAEPDLVRTAFALGQLSGVKDHDETKTASEASSDSEQFSPGSWGQASSSFATPKRRAFDIASLEADLLSSALALGQLRHSAATY